MQLPTAALFTLAALFVLVPVAPGQQRAGAGSPSGSGQSQSQQVPQQASFNMGGGAVPPPSQSDMSSGPTGSISIQGDFTSGMSGAGGSGGVWPQRKCVDITVPLCRGIGYNQTYMPNEFHQETQEEIAMEVHQFWPLVQLQCSSDLKFFLCSVYVPICLANYNRPLYPCRSVCERARQGCAPIMHHHGFAWPDRLRCDRFPVFGSDTLCMDFNVTSSSGRGAGSGSGGLGGPTTAFPKLPSLPPMPTFEAQSSGPLAQSSAAPPAAAGQKPAADGTDQKGPLETLIEIGKQFAGVTSKESTATPGTAIAAAVGEQPYEECKATRKCGCRAPLIQVRETHRSLLNRSTGGVPNCVLACNGSYGFSENEKVFMPFWVGGWAILCFLVSLATLLTFLIDTSRFKYPERPIVLLSFCYFFISIGYIVRLIVPAGHLSCDGEYVRYGGTGPIQCMMVFVLIYFFGMAASIWWVMLCLSWFLSAGLKWSAEAIAGYAQYYHVVAWALPALKTIAIIALNGIDGDPVVGICYVGNHDLTHLRLFVLVPLIIYLFFGTLFLLVGFVCMFRIRSAIKAQGSAKTDKLECLMLRLGVVSVLYTLPAATVIACLFYEQAMRDHWERSIACPECVHQKQEPLFFVFVVKYFMSIFVGITTGFWIWTAKTADSWWRFIERVVLCRRRAAKSAVGVGAIGQNGMVGVQMLRYNQVANGGAQQIAYTEFRSPPSTVQVSMPAQHHPLTAPQPLQQQTIPLLYYKPTVGPLSSQSTQSHSQHTAHSHASHGNVGAGVNGGTLGPVDSMGSGIGSGMGSGQSGPMQLGAPSHHSTSFTRPISVAPPGTYSNNIPPLANGSGPYSSGLGAQQPLLYSSSGSSASRQMPLVATHV